jgi:hypothetical protein
MNRADAFDPLAHDPLDRRLRSLVITTPPFPRAAGEPGQRNRRPAAARQRRLRVTAGLVATAAALLVGTAAVSPDTLSSIAQEALSAAGLTRAQVNPLQGTASHGATRVAVTGGYADNLSTVLFVDIALFTQPCPVRASVVGAPAGKGGGPGPSLRCGDYMEQGPYLTDQFGERYAIIGGEGIDVGSYPIFFEPLRGKAVRVGARLTIHVPIQTITAFSQPPRTGGYQLELELPGTLTPGTARSLPRPAPILTRGLTSQIVGLEYSGTYLRVHTRISGSTVVVPIGRGGKSWPGVALVDPSGSYRYPVAGSAHGREVHTEQLSDETRVFSAPSPGRYTIVVWNGPDAANAPGAMVLARWTIDVR